MKKLFRVNILSQGDGEKGICKTVLATNEKTALISVIKALPLQHRAWQWPGWQVEAYAKRE